MFVCIFLVISCDNVTNVVEQDVPHKNASILDSLNTVQYSVDIASLEQIKGINSELRNLWSDSYTFNTYYEYGALRIENSLIEWQDSTNSKYILSIPFQSGENISAIVFCTYVNGTYEFTQFDAKDISIDPAEMVDDHGEDALFLVNSFAKHQFNITQDINLYQNLLVDIINEIEARKNQVFCVYEIVQITYGSLSWIETNLVYCYGIGGGNGNGHIDPNPTGGDPEPWNDTNNDPGGEGIRDIVMSEECKETFNFQIEDFLEGVDIEFPCDDRTPTEVVQELVDELCDEGGIVSEQEFKDELNNYKSIRVPRGFDEDCPCMNWVIETVYLNGSPETWLCSIIQDMNTANNFTVDVVYSSLGPGTSFDNSTNTSTLYWDKNDCGNHGIQEAAELTHEFLHSYVHHILADFYPEGVPDDWIVPGSDTWSQAVREHFNIPPNEPLVDNDHWLFLDYMKEKLMDSFHQINGGIGEPSDYEYYANIVLNVEDMANNSPWNVSLGLATRNSETGEVTVTFNNNDYFLAWDLLDGVADNDSGFRIRC